MIFRMAIVVTLRAIALGAFAASVWIGGVR